MRISDWSSDVCASDLAIEVRRLVELVIARRLGVGRHAGVERRGAEDAGGDERAHQAFGENTHYKSFPGSAIPSLGEIGCFGEKTSRLPIALHEPKATRRNEIGRASCRERVCQYV